MANGKEIELFELPRPDWYDAEGRINKTALIANFNAIEAKCNELSEVDAIGLISPDWNSISIPDTTLESEETSILNIKSFVDIMGLKNFPIEVSTNGKTIKRLTYFDDDYHIVNINNFKLEGLGEDDKNWIFLNLETKSIEISGSSDLAENKVLVGVYHDGIIYHLGGINICDINILEPLSKMTRRVQEFSRPYSANLQNATSGGRLYGSLNKQDHSTGTNVTFQDQGF